MKSIIRISDVTARDGLQSFSKVFGYETKKKILNGLKECKFDEIEVGSLVNYDIIPTMKGSIELYSELVDSTSKYFLLVGNIKSIDIVNKNNVKNISLFTSPSDSFNIKNINCSVDKSFERFEEMIKKLDSKDVNIKGYLSCIGNCPYEGDVNIDKIISSINKYKKIGVNEVCIADTIGDIKNDKLNILLQKINNEPSIEIEDISLHLHVHYNDDEWKKNLETALKSGIKKYDTTLLNLGGCPSAYNKGKYPSGNLNIIKALDVFNNLGFRTNVNINEVKKMELILNDILFN